MECISCEKDFDIETMPEDDGGNYFCIECYEILGPVMAAEHKEVLEREKIEDTNCIYKGGDCNCSLSEMGSYCNY